MPLRVYNTLTHTKEEFVPVKSPAVGIYLCGPTVYKPSHIGHAVGPIIFDAIKRYLTFRGYKVTWVVNITDVEDKIIKAAEENGEPIEALTARTTEAYHRDMAALGALVELTGCVSLVTVEADLVEMLEKKNPKLLELNLEAIKHGADYVKKDL